MSGEALLDVNVLVALAWPNHLHHHAARRWFDRHHGSGWATTPITQSGFVRISSNRSAVANASAPSIALEVLGRLTGLAGHHFWSDDVQSVTGGRLDAELMVSHRDVTDSHLLAVAASHGGRLVTFDAGMTRLIGVGDPDLLQVLSAG